MSDFCGYGGGWRMGRPLNFGEICLEIEGDLSPISGIFIKKWEDVGGKAGLWREVGNREQSKKNPPVQAEEKREKAEATQVGGLSLEWRMRDA